VTFYSSSYSASRERFLLAAKRRKLELASYPIDQAGPDGSPLSIDVARLGPARPRQVLVVSSGTHGVEGFFGAAVQLALLDGLFAERRLPEHLGLVLVHAINPYGFAHRRRVNEDNIDLNRNFLLSGRPFSGAPEVYRALDPLLNPKAPRSAFEPFLAVAALQIARHGFSALKNAIAQGQYEFPEGVFFGGAGPAQTQRILSHHAAEWLGEPERVIHVDFHTGLGKWASYALCIDQPVGGPRIAQLSRELGAPFVQGYEPSGVLYEIQGGLGRWLEERFAATQYDCLLAEFGTYSALRVLQGLRAENYVHLHARNDARLYERTKRELVELFCPASPIWRARVLEQGVRVVAQALTALS
jgi:hypothetical protein